MICFLLQENLTNSTAGIDGASFRQINENGCLQRPDLKEITTKLTETEDELSSLKVSHEKLQKVLSEKASELSHAVRKAEVYEREAKKLRYKLEDIRRHQRSDQKEISNSRRNSEKENKEKENKLESKSCDNLLQNEANEVKDKDIEVFGDIEPKSSQESQELELKYDFPDTNASQKAIDDKNIAIYATINLDRKRAKKNRATIVNK